MSDRPMMDTGELFVGFYKRLPDPLKNFYRACLPQQLRLKLKNLLPYEQDAMRALRFWASPTERRRKKAELQRCQTPEDYFAFAARHLGHQQWKQEITQFL